MKSKLKSVFLSGYKSFPYDAPVKASGLDQPADPDEGKRITFGDVTVLLGANGAGKSNIVSFFKMLNFMTTDALQEYVLRVGGSNSLLHYGSQVTPRMRAEVEFVFEERNSRYGMILEDVAPDTLIFTKEFVEYFAPGHAQPQVIPLGSGHRESGLKMRAEQGEETCRVICNMLSGCRAYQFHDTSPTAKIRKGGYIQDAGYLRADAGNLAAYLCAVRESHPAYYHRIVEHVRSGYPQLGDFVLEPTAANGNYILLNWRERGRSEYLFGPHQLSDGTLRFMALAALFLQPPEKLPPVIVIDEPELGLHPYAILVLASMIRSASAHCQVILSTQSTRLVDEFDVGEIVVVERDRQSGATRCHRPDENKLEEWIQRYTTSELWEKNVLGGRP